MSDSFLSNFLKEISQHHPVMVMFSKGTTAALFIIVVISSLVVLSGFIESVYAAKKVKQHNYGMTLPVPFSGLPELSDDDKSSTQKAQGKDAGDLGWVFGDINDDTADKTILWREICNT